MSKTLKLEISVADLGQNGVVVSEFATTDYVANELSKKATLNDEGKVDPSLLPDYTYLDGLVDKLDDLSAEMQTAVHEEINAAITSQNQNISTALSDKADLRQGKVPQEQLPYPLNFADTVTQSIEGIRQEFTDSNALLAESIVDNLDEAKGYADTKVSELDQSLNNSFSELSDDVDAKMIEFNKFEKTNELKPFDSVFATQNNGYPLHSVIVLADGTEVISIVPDNRNNPNENMSGWKAKNDGSVKLYESVDEALKYTRSGEHFWVVSADENVVADQYVNNNGVANPLENTIPSDKKVDFIRDGVESIADLLAIQNPKDGMRVFVKGYHVGLGKGGGYFIFDSSKSSVNDGGVCINGWLRQLENNVLNPFMFGAYGDFIPEAHEVIRRKSGHDDSIAFQNMYNMNEYTVFSNISKLPPVNKAQYTFEWGNVMFYIEDTLPVRSYQFTDCKGGKIFFNPVGHKDLFTTPRQEMIDAYTLNTGWNTQTICYVTFKDGVIVGNVDRNSTVHANKCFDAANPYKWVFDNMLIERFTKGIHIYPLDTSEWTGGNRIGNFYENELRNVSIHECITGFHNQGNATHCSNLTIGGGYIVGVDYLNKFDYLLINTGAGFSCTGFNIAPAHRQGGKALIYDYCWGSSYSGGYTEWFDTFFELHPQVRQGGFSLTGSHVFKEGSDLLIKIQDDVFSKFNYSTETRSVKAQLPWNQLFNSTGMTIGGKTDLITNFFKYVPQYDFKYGLYGVEADDGLVFDVKRSEQTWTGFTSKYGLRVLNFTGTTKSIRMPIENKDILANVCVLYRNISGFSHAEIKLNVLEADGTNAKITIAEDVIDYGNGWKLAVVRNINEIVSDGKLWIDIPANAQVEFEHIGAYSADGYPFMPTYTSYEPSINSGYDRLYDSNTSGGFLLESDTTRAFLSVNGGAVHARSKKPRVCTTSGSIYPDITQGTDVTISAADNTLLLASADSQPISNVGVGAVLRVQQSSIIGYHRVVGRNFGTSGFTKNVKVSKDLSTERSIFAGSTIIYASEHIRSAVLADI